MFNAEKEGVIPGSTRIRAAHWGFFVGDKLLLDARNLLFLPISTIISAFKLKQNNTLEIFNP